MRPDALRTSLERDVAEGRTPVAVVATGGTTLTGAVDPIAAVADVCADHGVWLHIDGAYGLPAAASETAGHWFEGLDRADSVTVDAHKWLGMQKSCSVILVRRPGSLHGAFGHQERYLLSEDDAANPVDSTFEYSRPFRSLRFWLSMRVHGAQRFRSWIDATLHNAARLAAAVKEHPDFELLDEPMLSTVCFRHVPPGVEDLDAHNRRLARAMQVDGRVFLAPAIVDGMTCLRTCFVNYRTTPEAVDMVLPVAAGLGEALTAGA
jgi:aromatic-L-amino-acid decarboxylase